MPLKINTLAHDQYSDVFAVYVLFPVGAIHEPYEMRGCSHILEHMLFRNRRNDNIMKRLTTLGARYNGFTSYDVTGYFINTTSEHHNEAIKILHDMTMSAKFTDEDLIRERKVILEEFWQTNGNYDRRKTNTLLSEDNIYNRNIIGRPEVIKRITAKDLSGYHKAKYTQPIVVVFCDIKIQNSVSKTISKLFGKQETYDYFDDKIISSAKKIEPQIIVMYSGGPGQNLLRLSFLTYPAENTRKHIILHFLNHCFTRSSVYSLLGQKLRINRGMVYSNYSSSDELMYLGMFMFMIRSVENNMDYVTSLLLDVISQIKKRGLGTSKLLNFYKKSYLNHVKSKRTTEDFMTDLAISYVYGDNKNKHPVKTIISVINSITNDELSKIATEAFDFEKLGILTVGNYSSTNTMSNKIQDVIDSYY